MSDISLSHTIHFGRWKQIEMCCTFDLTACLGLPLEFLSFTILYT